MISSKHRPVLMLLPGTASLPILMAKLQQLMPAGYMTGGGSGEVGKHFTLSAMTPYGFQYLSASGSAPYQVAAKLRALIRQDQKVTRIAEAMCLALGLNPNIVGPYPIGPVQVGILGTNGGAFIGPGVGETHRNGDWLRPHAVMMLAAMKEIDHG
jgi:hypothetical protein